MQVGDLFRMIEEMLGKPIEIKYQHDPNSGHYQITPYAFRPKVGRKMTPHLSTELGQGVLRSWKKSIRNCTRTSRSSAGT